MLFTVYIRLSNFSAFSNSPSSLECLFTLSACANLICHLQMYSVPYHRIIFVFSDTPSSCPRLFLGSFGTNSIMYCNMYMCLCPPLLQGLSFFMVGSISNFYFWTDHKANSCDFCVWQKLSLCFFNDEINESLLYVFHHEFCTMDTSAVWKGKL